MLNSGVKKDLQSPKHVTGYNKNEKLYQCCEQYSCVLFLGQFLTYHSLLEFNNVVMYNFSFYKTKTSKTIKLANNKNLETLLQDTKDPLYEPNFVLKCYITTQWSHLRLIIKSNVRSDNEVSLALLIIMMYTHICHVVFTVCSCVPCVSGLPRPIQLSFSPGGGPGYIPRSPAHTRPPPATRPWASAGVTVSSHPGEKWGKAGSGTVNITL